MIQVVVSMAGFVLREGIVVWGREEECYPYILQNCPTIQLWSERSRNTTNEIKSWVSIQSQIGLSSRCEISCTNFLYLISDAFRYKDSVIQSSQMDYKAYEQDRPFHVIRIEISLI